VFREHRIVDATIVEGLCALWLAIAAYAGLSHRAWAWLAATEAWGLRSWAAGCHLGARAGLGPSTTTNIIYRRAILLVLVVDLALLQTPAAKSPPRGCTTLNHAARQPGKWLMAFGQP